MLFLVILYETTFQTTPRTDRFTHVAGLAK